MPVLRKSFAEQYAERALGYWWNRRMNAFLNIQADLNDDALDAEFELADGEWAKAYEHARITGENPIVFQCR
jgi:hypothetical protein